jgi:23S rRNA (cytosine1962-C5)-methyltransferase
MNTPDFRSLLETAWKARSALRARTNAYRLLNGAASGAPGLVVDMFSRHAVVYAYAKDLRARYGDFPAALADVAGAESVALKDRAAKDESGREEGEDLLGQSPESAEVREGALSFIVHLRHPRNVGLFLDTRPLREILAARSGDTLNLFSYACSLGVAAAAGARLHGAAGAEPGRVVNVDVSSRYLEWGRLNYRANNLAEAKGAFSRMDCEEYLDWAARKGAAFDAVILDPPSFSRGEGGTYTFTRDYPRLLEKCARIARPGATLYALTNYAKISPPEFHSLVEETLRNAHVTPKPRLAGLRGLPLPEDFDPPAAGSPWKPSSEGSLIALAATLA